MQQKSFLSLNPQGFHRVVYYEWGDRNAARTIVCVHGLTRNARDFDDFAAKMSDAARIISVDVVGRGESDHLGDAALYAYPQYLADMTALLARLDVKEVDWVGASMGGLIGMLLAAQRNNPIRRLVLNDIGPFLPQAAIARIGSYISNPPDFPHQQAVTEYFRTIYSDVGPCTPQDMESMTQHSARKKAGGGFILKFDPAIAANFATIKEDVDLWMFYDKITCPVLALRGAKSDILLAETAADMTQRGPKARLETFADLGHYPILTDEQIKLTRDFLTR